MVHGNKESDVSEKEMLSTSWGSITKVWFMSPDQSLIGPPGLQSNLRPKTFITVKEFTQSLLVQVNFKVATPWIIPCQRP